jgi:hypothetical protein
MVILVTQVVKINFCSISERRFLEIDQSETRMACGDLVY